MCVCVGVGVCVWVWVCVPIPRMRVCVEMQVHVYPSHALSLSLSSLPLFLRSLSLLISWQGCLGLCLPRRICASLGFPSRMTCVILLRCAHQSLPKAPHRLLMCRSSCSGSSSASSSRRWPSAARNSWASPSTRWSNAQIGNAGPFAWTSSNMQLLMPGACFVFSTACEIEINDSRSFVSCCQHTHTHTHTHTRIHTCTHSITHTHTRVRAYVRSRANDVLQKCTSQPQIAMRKSSRCADN